MNVPTGEFKALSERVEALEEDRRVLVRMAASLLPPAPEPERLELRLIKGGRA